MHICWKPRTHVLPTRRVHSNKWCHTHTPHTHDTHTCVDVPVMPHTRRTHMSESCPIWASHVPYEWVMSHMSESCPIWVSHVPYEWVMSHMSKSCPIWASDISYARVRPHTHSMSRHDVTNSWCHQNVTSSVSHVGDIRSASNMRQKIHEQIPSSPPSPAGRSVFSIHEYMWEKGRSRYVFVNSLPQFLCSQFTNTYLLRPLLPQEDATQPTNESTEIEKKFRDQNLVALSIHFLSKETHIYGKRTIWMNCQCASMAERLNALEKMYCF